jgi:hypothetical protein
LGGGLAPLKEYTYKNIGGTGKYGNASGGGTYMLEELTDALLGGKYKGTIELPDGPFNQKKLVAEDVRAHAFDLTLLLLIELDALADHPSGHQRLNRSIARTTP